MAPLRWNSNHTFTKFNFDEHKRILGEFIDQVAIETMFLGFLFEPGPRWIIAFYSNEVVSKRALSSTFTLLLFDGHNGKTANCNCLDSKLVCHRQTKGAGRMMTSELNGLWRFDGIVFDVWPPQPRSAITHTQINQNFVVGWLACTKQSNNSTENRK